MHPPRGPTPADPGGRRHGDLVAFDLEEGVANRTRWPAQDRHLDDLARPAPGRVQPATESDLVSDRHRPPRPQERTGLGHRSRHRVEKKWIEAAYLTGEAQGLPVLCCDQAGPFQTIPQPGTSWQPQGRPARQPHDYVRNGTAKILTLFRPADGRVRVEGVTACPNAVLHDWLRRELTAALDVMPPSPGPKEATAEATRAAWERWQEGLSIKPTLLSRLPPLRLLLVLDNLAGHKTPEFVCWLFAQGIMPLYTPLGGSWLNMAESIQRILKRRALDGQHPSDTAEIIGWFEVAARHWNAAPTPFSWGGRRRERRRRRERCHRVGGSGAYTRHPVRRTSTAIYGHAQRE